MNLLFLAKAQFPFVRWAEPHLAALAIILLIGVAIFVWGHRGDELHRQRLCHGVAYFLIGEMVLEFGWRWSTLHYGSLAENLPLHFCSVMMIVAAIALRWQWNWACALVYFGVLTASIQALVTPAMADGYPSPVYYFFFASHGALLWAAIAVLGVLRWKPQRGDALRSLLLMDAYLLCAIPLNTWLGTNYGFTQESPVPGCILDYLGSAPWYYLWLQLPALAIFCFMARLLNYRIHK